MVGAAAAWGLALLWLLGTALVERVVLAPLTTLQGAIALAYSGAPAIPVRVTLACSGANVLGGHPGVPGAMATPPGGRPWWHGRHPHSQHGPHCGARVHDPFLLPLLVWRLSAVGLAPDGRPCLPYLARPLTRLTALTMRPIEWLHRRAPATYPHGYLIVAVARRPAR